MSAVKKSKPKKSRSAGTVAITKPRREKPERRNAEVRRPGGATEGDRTGSAEVKKGKAKKAEKGNAEPKRLSALDAAAEVLKKADKPMRCPELIAAMAEQGLWISPKGKTPHATLYSAIQRETMTKGKASRFTKVDRGRFAYNAESGR